MPTNITFHGLADMHCIPQQVCARSILSSAFQPLCQDGIHCQVRSYVWCMRRMAQARACGHVPVSFWPCSQMKHWIGLPSSLHVWRCLCEQEHASFSHSFFVAAYAFRSLC